MHEAIALLGSCAWPSEAFWRLLELEAVWRCRQHLRSPVAEIGCGDGQFTTLLGVDVQVGIDREARAVSRARSSGAYERALRLDLHALGDLEGGPFETIFANSVLEHVSELERGLATICSGLRPGGKLVTSVPLAAMNRHLASGRPRYVTWRQRQLEHRNLWTKRTWERELRAAGFSTMQWVDYLPGPACRWWDAVDIFGALGLGRYRVATVSHGLLGGVLSRGVKARAKQQIGRSLLDRARRDSAGEACASVLVASAP